MYESRKIIDRVKTEEGVETEAIQIGNKDIRGCIACGSCAGTGKCVFDDVVNEIAPKFEAADGLTGDAFQQMLPVSDPAVQGPGNQYFSIKFDSIEAYVPKSSGF